MQAGKLTGIRRRTTIGIVSALITIASLLASCGGIPRAYSGPRREESEVARLRTARGKILEIDGVERFASRFELLPGEHDVVVRFVLQGDEIAPNVRAEDVVRVVCRSRATLLAGGNYRLALEKPVAVDQRSVVTRYSRRVSLVDEADGRRLFLSFECDKD